MVNNKILIFFVGITMVSFAAICFAEGMKTNDDILDERRELKLPPHMKIMQKKMMRRHMNTVGELTGLLAANDLKGAASLAREKLGWSKEEEKKCSNVSNITGEPGFLELGMELHKEADKLADLAEKGDRNGALSALSGLILRCNACHEQFRH